MNFNYEKQFCGTTVVSVRRHNTVAMAADGQITFAQSMILKSNAKKVRRLFKDKVIAGFAGGTADAFTLFEKFEAKLEAYSGHLTRAAVELAKDWRTDKILRRLEAMLCVADARTSLIITGNGDVIEPEDGLMAIGSGGAFAKAAATGLLEHTNMSAVEIVEKSLDIAAKICIFTNDHRTIEVIEWNT